MKNESIQITITHLYPRYMNIYGDKGNVIALIKRCEWRGYSVSVKEISKNENLPEDTDIYFIGGGQDEDQIAVFQDLVKKKSTLKQQLHEGVGMLAICGGYQLLGNHFYSGDNKDIKGIGILDIETSAPSREVSIRAVGNVVARINDQVLNIPSGAPSTIVGFENHSGQTTLGREMQPLGIVMHGTGNNSEDNTEGCVYKHVIGTYLHGSFLPKNPHIADWLIEKSLMRKYADFKLNDLNDEEEYEVHNEIVRRFT